VGLAAAAAVAAADAAPLEAGGGATPGSAEPFSLGPGCEKHIPAYATDAQRRYLRDNLQVREVPPGAGFEA
jgi:hypothetical protein